MGELMFAALCIGALFLWAGKHKSKPDTLPDGWWIVGHPNYIEPKWVRK